jgi:precorrin-3B synthase
VAILFAGADRGLRVPPSRVVAALLAAAHAFLAERAADAARGDGPAWRIRELRDGPARVAARTAARLGVALRDGPAVPGPAPRPREPVGVLAQPDGLVAVAALVPLGRLGAVPLGVLAEAGLVIVAPWRGVVVPDLPPEAAGPWVRALAGAGLDVAAGSRWWGVTACAGRPGCASALADVRGAAAAGAAPGGGLPVHWVGCARGCGSPAGPHVRVEARASGYAVTAPGFAARAAAADVGDLVVAARRG